MFVFRPHLDIFKAPCQAIVNPVNCVGVSGKGLALEFAKRFPQVQYRYQNACSTKLLKPGTTLAIELTDEQRAGYQPELKWIILFPTKDHWRNNSCILNIRAALFNLKEQIRQKGIQSIAIPRLGCGLGGLKWKEVQPHLMHCLRPVSDDCRIEILSHPAPLER